MQCQGVNVWPTPIFTQNMGKIDHPHGQADYLTNQVASPSVLSLVESLELNIAKFMAVCILVYINWQFQNSKMKKKAQK